MKITRFSDFPSWWVRPVALPNHRDNIEAFKKSPAKRLLKFKLVLRMNIVEFFQALATLLTLAC